MSREKPIITSITPEMLKPFDRGVVMNPPKGFLTYAEAMTRARVIGTVTTHRFYDPCTGERFLFFSDDHLFGHNVLPRNVVPVTTCTRGNRASFEGIYPKEYTIIENIDEACQKVNQLFFTSSN